MAIEHSKEQAEMLKRAKLLGAWGEACFCCAIIGVLALILLPALHRRGAIATLLRFLDGLAVNFMVVLAALTLAWLCAGIYFHRRARHIQRAGKAAPNDPQI